MATFSVKHRFALLSDSVSVFVFKVISIPAFGARLLKNLLARACSLELKQRSAMRSQHHARWKAPQMESVSNIKGVPIRGAALIIIVLVGLTAWSGYQARADQREAAEREREREHEERALSMWAARRARRGGECVGRS